MRAILIPAAMCALPATAQVPPTAAANAPVIPINSNFWSYWTHYWTTWLPDHPVYEMIELTAYENPADPSDVFVRVFLTERAGRKTQYFYVNNEAEARRSRANTHFRNIEYRRSGPAGGPQNIEVRFSDKDGVPIHWTIRFDPGARLRTRGAELTPSIHSVGSVMLLALRTRTVETRDDRVMFGDVDYAHSNAAGTPAQGTGSWYNPDYFSAVLVYGRTAFTLADGVLTNSWGRAFSPIPGRPGTYRSNALGPENFIEFSVDRNAGVRRYAHFSRGHSLVLAFEPALPTHARARNGQRIGFNASFDGSRPLMTGHIRVRRPQPDQVVFDWVPSGPAWAIGRNFRSSVSLKENGYEVTSGESRD
jgi:hypothetical protein